MSALGQKQTCTAHKLMSALAPIATAIADSVKGHVCFTPESGHVQCTRPCLLWARSGHLLLDTSSASASTVGGTVRPTAIFDYCRPAFRKPWGIFGSWSRVYGMFSSHQAMETLGCNSFMRCNADLNLASLRKTLRPAVSQLVDRRSVLPNSQIKYGILLFIVRYMPLPSRSVSAIFTTVSG
jgi:hypothetical protein